MQQGKPFPQQNATNRKPLPKLHHLQKLNNLLTIKVVAIALCGGIAACNESPFLAEIVPAMVSIAIEIVASRQEES